MPHDTRPLSLPGFLILIATAIGPMLVLALDAAARRTGGLKLGQGIPMLQHAGHRRRGRPARHGLHASGGAAQASGEAV